MPECQLPHPKQVFELYSKSEIKGFKTDEKGMRVVLRKIMESESNSNAVQGEYSSAEPPAAYQTFGSASKNPSSAAYINESSNNKFESLNCDNTNLISNYDKANLGQSEFLVGSGRKDNASRADYEVESANAEMQKLRLRLKSLMSENAELNEKIKAEQRRTRNFTYLSIYLVY